MKKAHTQFAHLLAAEIDPAYAGRAKSILTAVEHHRPQSVLEVGCGRGFYLQALTALPFVKKIVGIDVNDEYLARAKQAVTDPRVTIQKADALKLPFKAGAFDLVICSEVLEHIPDDDRVLEEMYRVLQPGGHLVVSVPHFHFPFFWDPLNFILMKLFQRHVNKDIWWLAGIWAGHERLYTHRTLVQLVKKSGFIHIETQPICSRSWPFTHFLLYGIGKNMVERLGIKEFDRFSQDTPKLLSKLLAVVFRLPELVWSNPRPRRYANIFLTATK